MQDIAVGMANVCVRNTIIEKYHAEGKLSDAEMKVFNQEVASKLYSALHFLLEGTPAEKQAVLRLLAEWRLPQWDAPEINESFQHAIEAIANSRGPGP
jgi:hypothetical protein